MAYKYYVFIHTLIAFKDKLYLVNQPKYDQLKTILQTFKITYDEDGDVASPSLEDILASLKVPKLKGSKLIRDLHTELMTQLWRDPPQIKNHVHTLIMSIPLDERRSKKGLGFISDDRTRYLNVKLPVTPRIGEEIDLRLFDDLQYSRGYVHNVTHVVFGDVVDIEIWVHPFKNEYSKWMKMKQQYEWDERRKRLEKN